MKWKKKKHPFLPSSKTEESFLNLLEETHGAEMSFEEISFWLFLRQVFSM